MAATALVLLTGCYKATVNTGIAPGPVEVVEWKSTWINGLVPAETVNADEVCGDSGVSSVETQHTFVNQLVAALTAGIYTPMTVTVRCGNAAGDAEGAAGDEAGGEANGGTEASDSEGHGK